MISIAAILAIGPVLASAVQEPTAAPARIELKLDAKTAPVGGALKGQVWVTFAAGWHGYQNPPMRDYEIPLKIEGATKEVKVKAVYPKGELKDFAGAQTLMYEGLVKVPITVTVPKKTGAYKFELNVSYQQCNEGTCLPPESQKVAGSVNVVALAKPKAPPKPTKPPSIR